jgi:UDP-glucose 4-epimerase
LRKKSINASPQKSSATGEPIMNPSANCPYSRVAITGGSGFVGGAIAKRLLIEGCPEVLLLSRRGVPPLSLENWTRTDRLQVIACDIRDRNAVGQALAGCDAVFHQAAIRVTHSVRDPSLAYDIMMHGTCNVLSASADHGVKKVIAASSAAIYGEAQALPISESHPVEGTTPYAIAKIQNECLLSFYRRHFDLDYTILRYFNVYGPGMTLFGDDIEVLIRWLDRIDAGMPPLMFDDGHQTLDWVFIDDVVEANWRALLLRESGEVFNVCSGMETSMLDLLEKLTRVVRKDVSPEFHPPRTVNHVRRRVGDPRKAEQRLKFRAQVRLEDGLSRLVAWRAGMLAQHLV